MSLKLFHNVISGIIFRLVFIRKFETDRLIFTARSHSDFARHSYNCMCNTMTLAITVYLGICDFPGVLKYVYICISLSNDISELNFTMANIDKNT